MTWPATQQDLEAAGWSFLYPGKCRKCKAQVSFWRSPVRGVWEMSKDGDGLYTSHFSNCPAAKEFKRK